MPVVLDLPVLDLQIVDHRGAGHAVRVGEDQQHAAGNVPSLTDVERVGV